MSKKKISVSVSSKIFFGINELDPFAPISGADLARLLDVGRSTISRGVNNGIIIREKNGLFIPAKNARYFSMRHVSNLGRLSDEQMNAYAVFLEKIKSGPQGPTATSTPPASEPRPYSPGELSPGAVYEIGTLGKKLFIPLVRLFTGEHSTDGIELQTLSPKITLSIDAAGNLSGIFADEKRIADLFFREVTE